MANLHPSSAQWRAGAEWSDVNTESDQSKGAAQGRPNAATRSCHRLLVTYFPMSPPGDPTQLPDAASGAVRILFGRGGFVRAHLYGAAGDRGGPVELTRFAAALASVGIAKPRGVAPPSEVTGYLDVDFGEGGRAMWVDAGGDIDQTEVGWAIAAALELHPDESLAAIDAVKRAELAAEARRTEELLRRALTATGYSSRRINSFMSHPSPHLGGRSPRDVLQDQSARVEEFVETVNAATLRLSDGAERERFLSVLTASLNERPRRR